MTKKVYMVRSMEDQEGAGLWMIYNSIHDAVCECPNADIYSATPKKLGKFKMELNFVRIKEKPVKKSKSKSKRGI